MFRDFALTWIVCMLTLGCWVPPKPRPPTLEEQNAETLTALRMDREAFELAANGDRSNTVMQRLRKCGVSMVHKDRGCIEFRWPFTHVLDSIPVIYYAPAGRDDLPSGFWNSSHYLHPMEVEPNWFVASEE